MTAEGLGLFSDLGFSKTKTHLSDRYLQRFVD